MPSMLSTMHIVATIILAVSSLAEANNIRPDDSTAHGLTIFYKIQPSEEQIAHFSSGEFDNALLPPCALECGPDPRYPFHPPSFSCSNPDLAPNTTTPETIYDYGIPRPDCMAVGMAFEHFQWATWTHACWQRPQPALDTPDGHAEQAFQSSALSFRALVLYQHSKHLLTLNTAIRDLRLAADAEILTMHESLAKNLADIDAQYDAEIHKLPHDEGGHRNGWAGEKGWNEEREEKKKTLNADAEKAVWAREIMFWKDSWVHRAKTVEIDHLVGEYFERWMTGRTQGGWEWAGMGEPEPAFPVDFRVD